MAHHTTIRRYVLIIEKIEQNRFPPFEQLRNYLFDQGIDVSKRTIERDLEQIRYVFGLNIKYDRSREGYYIDKEQSSDFEAFMRFLEIVNTAQLLTESLAESGDALNYISFDKGGGLQNVELLKPLLRAATEHRTISFEHLNFQTGKLKAFTLEPYLLKEYQNRWYVVGWFQKRKAMLTFGVDRIRELKVNTEIFTPNEALNPKYQFEQIIGVKYVEEKTQKVVLSFTPFQGNYVKSLPIHSTQKTIIDDDNEFRIELWLIPNYELTQYILMHNNNVRVIEPEWLITEVKERLKNTLNQY